MSAPFKRHYATARSGTAGASGMRIALDCARSIHEAVDRRMPEAAALANWLRQSAAAFGLPDTAIPDDDTTPPVSASRRPRAGLAQDRLGVNVGGGGPGSGHHFLGPTH